MSNKSKNKLRILLARMVYCTCFLVLLFYGVRYLLKCVGKNSQSAQTTSNKPVVGRWRTVNDAVPSDWSFDDEVGRLSSLPYLQAYNKAPLEENVTVFDVDLAYEGLNLYNSGHAAEAGIMDMRGKVLHKWTYNFEDIPHKKPINRADSYWKEAATHWRRVHLYENGDILAIYEAIFMIKLDKDSNLLWVSKAGGVHHHMQVTEDGNIYVLVKKVKRMPAVTEDNAVIVDFIVILDPDGKPIGGYSLLKSFENSSYAYILSKMRNQGELFHTNTIQVFNGELSHISPLFKKGNVLISVLYLNTIAIVNLEKNRVVWAMDGHECGLWNGMHEPVLLENGNILIVDNNWGELGVKRKAKVIEFNPFTKEVVWEYKGDDEHPFYSRTCGTNQRLPNGNTLITESDNGRAFEVTQDGRIVWEYINPHRAGENNELIATLHHTYRIDRDFVRWLAPGEQR
jgi:hypothetical protein